MVSRRPLLYLSLPGVAFILGMLWFRRRNKNGLDPNEKIDVNSTEETCRKAENVDDSITKKTHAQNMKSKDITTPKVSKSMNISGKPVLDEEDSSTNRLFGKSAPINIVQNGRNSSPVKQIHHQQLDCEILKSKIQNAEHKLLRSIDEDFENLSSPIDLPDSVESRLPFYVRKIEDVPTPIDLTEAKDNELPFWARRVDVNKPKTVVITANRTPKVSPENSFLSKKCTKECEQENKLESLKHDISEVYNDKEDAVAQACSGVGRSALTTSYDVGENDVPKEAAKDVDHSDLSDEKRNVDVASPSLSLCSAQSGDSGKGCSLPPSEPIRNKSSYEFFFPNSLVGQLYGRKRYFINQIKTKTNADVMLRKNRGAGKVRVCVIDGTESEIQAALDMIRQRLPAKRYPNFTMQRIHFALPQSIVPLSTESLLNLQLNLIEGINNDVVVSSIISGGHLFVQHPLHPSHPSLALLQRCMYDTYNIIEAPLLPRIEISAVCVLPVNGFWYRVQIIEQDPEEEERCVIKFLDFGGYMNVHINDLRQIRSDLMMVPFQATECILSNIEPTETVWTAEAADALHNLTKGIVLQAQVAGYNSLSVPEVYLFANVGHEKVIFINKELVARGLAKWIDVKD